MTAIHNLLRGAVDYAGLFPPAGLPMSQVVDNYAKYLNSNERAMLGRLIVPTARLEEFEIAARDLLPTDNATTPWRISALIPPILEDSGTLDTTAQESAIRKIQEFNDAHLIEGDVAVVVDAVEVKTSSTRLVEATIECLPEGLNAFLEIPWNSDPEPSLELIAGNQSGKRLFAKIRTGDVTPQLIPSIESVANFIFACARHQVGFKATAGLHHPIRGEQDLTYENDAPRAYLHGYLNMFIATVIAFEHQANQVTLQEVLANQDPTRFEFEESSLTWKSLSVSSEAITRMRNSSIISFGSCSFTEPTIALQKLPNVSGKSVFSS